MRIKVEIDKGELVAAIEKVESGVNAPKSRSELYKLVGEILSKPPGSVMGRIVDYGIECKTPERRRGESSSNGVDGETSLDLSEFTNLGLVVEDISDLLTSSKKDRKMNLLIHQGWMAIRKRSGHTAVKVTPINVISIKDGEVIDTAVVYSESAAEEIVLEMEEENAGGVTIHRLAPITWATARSARLEK